MGQDPGLDAPAPADPAHALTPVRAPDRATDLSSAVYGSLLVTTLVAVQARSDASVEFIAGTLFVAVGVFWAAEVWAELVNHQVRGPVARHQVLEVMRDESLMLSAAVVPALVMGLSALGITTVEVALDLALVACVVQLFVWGLAVGIALRRGPVVALAVAAVDCLLGIALVVLKVFVLH